MTASVVQSPPRWVISARIDGEVLVARAADGPLSLLLLSGSAGYSAEDIQNWLADLISVATEAGASGTGGPVPDLLHRALTGLLFSHAELWERTPAHQPCSLACLASGDALAFGWVGDADVCAWVNDEPVSPAWVRVRDSSGREARALSVDPKSYVRVVLMWSNTADDGTVRRAEVTAEWPPSSASVATNAEPARTDAVPRTEPAAQEVRPTPPTPVDTPPRRHTVPPPPATPPASRVPPAPTRAPAPPPVSRAPEPAPVADVEPAAPAIEPEVPAAEKPAWQFRSWVDRLGLGVSSSPTPAEAPRREADLVPPTPEPQSLTARTAPVGHEHDEVVIHESPDADFEAVHERALAEALGGAFATPEASPSPAPPDQVEPPYAPPVSEPQVEPEIEPQVEAAIELPAGPSEIEFLDVVAEVEPQDAPSQIEALPTYDELPAYEEAPAYDEAPSEPWSPPADEPAPPMLSPETSSDSGMVPLQILSTAEETHRSSESTELEPVFSMPSLISRSAPGAPPEPEMTLSAAPEPADPEPSPASPERQVEIDPDLIPMSSSRIEEIYSPHPAEGRRAPHVDFLQSDDVPMRPRATVARTPVRDWPEEPEHHMPWALIFGAAAVVALLFAFGLLLGTTSGGRARDHGPLAGMMHAFDAIGLGPGHFTLNVDSQPQGAWISVDGKELNLRTPAAIDLKPGPHDVTLGVQNLGTASFPVRGQRGERVPLTGQLWGSLSIRSEEPGVVMSVTVDATPRGNVPVSVDGLAPGIHKVEFTAPGIGGWEQTAEVHVHETAELIARPLASAPTGFLQVQATLSSGGEPQPISGARVWVDGEPRGTTPLKLELPRGPHSVRVAWRTDASEVQMIDLPGGNTRYAAFELGTEAIPPAVVMAPIPERVPLDHPTVMSATLSGVSAGDVREMWLHVNTADGAWRRYPMNLLRTPGNAAGAAVFPLTALDARGRARWYVSVLVAAGDEYFTEIQTIQSAR